MPSRSARQLEVQLEALEDIRKATADLLRQTFACRGFDVTNYDDEQLSRAILDAVLDSSTGEELLGQAFKWLTSARKPVL